ncbi:Ras-like protein RAS2 [Geodia barretti]|uniref:Ras-like protein RAS2 n=1 Tax=Geodia barretti TaxID=519541 RepID=A0AA35SWT4_GEOBA|nr:Ras-like protein RAS2 [Geodia barretti]
MSLNIVDITNCCKDDVPLLLVGNKIDLEDERVVTTAEGKAMAARIGARYLETSAKEGIKVFFDILRLITNSGFQAEECLEVALKDGYIPHRDDLFPIHGPGGVGKSSLISMFQGKERDLARVSTALTAEPLHLCPVRDVSTSTFTGPLNLAKQQHLASETSSVPYQTAMATSKAFTQYKLLVVGARWTGKSELISQFIQGNEIEPAAEDFYRKQCIIDDKVAVLDILDTTGQETLTAMSDMYIRTQEGFLLVYSIRSRMTFHDILDYHEQILRAKDMPDVPMVLVANEPHEEERMEQEEREVSTAEGEALALQLKIRYVETSAKHTVNVSKAFHDLVRLIRESQNKNVEFSVKKILKAALRDGFIPHKDDKFLIHGPGGAGKSSLIAMFLGKQRDLIRISTPVANQSLHLCPVRDVSTKTYTRDWKEIDYSCLSRMIAHTTHLMYQRWANEKENTAYVNKETASDDKPQQEAYLASSRYLGFLAYFDGNQSSVLFFYIGRGEPYADFVADKPQDTESPLRSNPAPPTLTKSDFNSTATLSQQPKMSNGKHHVDDSPGRTLTGCDLQTQQVCDLPTTQHESASGPELSRVATKEKTKVAPLFTGKLHTFVNKSEDATINKATQPSRVDQACKMAAIEEYYLVVCGGEGVGKSELMLKFVEDREYDPDPYRKKCVIDGEVVFLDVMSTAGLEEFSAMREQYNHTGDGFLLVYSVDNRNSFEEIRKYYRQILRVKDKSKFPMVLVANNSDSEMRVISAAEGMELASELKIQYFEASLKDRIGVEEPF